MTSRMKTIHKQYNLASKKEIKNSYTMQKLKTSLENTIRALNTVNKEFDNWRGYEEVNEEETNNYKTEQDAYEHIPKLLDEVLEKAKYLKGHIDA